MDSRLYSAATTGTNLDLFNQFKHKLGDEKAGSGDTVLHVASQFGQLEVVKRILSLNQQLLLESNVKYEYALHLAARGGHSSIVRELIHCAKQMPPGPGDIEKGSTDGEERAKGKIMKSETYGNRYTPLHEAVRSRHVDVVKMLIEEDPEYSYIPEYNREMQETPLYLAARRGFDELVEVILKKCKSPAYSGPNGKTALHGAVISNSKRCVVLLLNWKTDIVKEEDSNGQTPLHFVAHLGYADLVSSLLLSDKSVAYIKDYESNTAIHIAANRGHVSVLKEIMSQCPDSWNMEGCNNQNILHMAVKHQQKNVIEYILKECPIIDALINQIDYDGNTPLHLLSISNYSLPQLILHPMADKGVSNYDKMTPLDLVTNNVDMPMATKNEIVEELKNAGATVGLPYQRNVKKDGIFGEEKEENFEEERKKIWEEAQTHVIVATLIATITFAAGFTMPGGFIQSGSSHQGMAVLTKSTAFQAFIISDTIALVLSTSAIFMYFFASRYSDTERIMGLVSAAFILNVFALLAMMVAFVTGIYAVLSNSLALAIATCVGYTLTGPRLWSFVQEHSLCTIDHIGLDCCDVQKLFYLINPNHIMNATVNDNVVICYTVLPLSLESNEKDEYALHLASRGGHSSIVRELINCAKEMPPGPGDIEKGCIHRVEQAKDKIMKSETFTEGYTSLHEAVRSRHVDVVKILIDEDPETPILPSTSRTFRRHHFSWLPEEDLKNWWT
ncbi:hypothetical protein LguiA_031048 [Lonicera macranthoides]